MNRPNITLTPRQDLPYWIERTGSFESAHQLPDHEHCGFLHGHSYNYIVIVRTNSLTDDWGFVIDFSTISKYFNKFDHSGVILNDSCEQFTEKAANDILDLLPQSDAEVHVFIQETAKSWAGFSRSKSVSLALQAATEASSVVPMPKGKLTAEAYLGDPV